MYQAGIGTCSTLTASITQTGANPDATRTNALGLRAPHAPEQGR
jgi:hypothetical protein